MFQWAFFFYSFTTFPHATNNIQTLATWLLTSLPINHSINGFQTQLTYPLICLYFLLDHTNCRQIFFDVVYLTQTMSSSMLTSAYPRFKYFSLPIIIFILNDMVEPAQYLDVNTHIRVHNSSLYRVRHLTFFF